MTMTKTKATKNKIRGKRRVRSQNFRKAMLTPTALRRSLVADGFLAGVQQMAKRQLDKNLREAIIRISFEDTPIVSQSMLSRWQRNFANAYRPFAFTMTFNGAELAKEEFAEQGKSRKGIKGKQETLSADELLFPDDAELFLNRTDFQGVEAHVNQVSKSVTRTQAKRIQRLFDRSASDLNSFGGTDTPRQLSKKILEQGLAQNINQARTIARTETIWAYNHGAVETYKEFGVTVMEWVVTFDDALCPWCESMNGAKIRTGDNFFQDGNALTVQSDSGPRTLTFATDIPHPPLHPNCRCTLVPVIETVSVPVLTESTNPARAVKPRPRTPARAGITQANPVFEPNPTGDFSNIIAGGDNLIPPSTV